MIFPLFLFFNFHVRILLAVGLYLLKSVSILLDFVLKYLVYLIKTKVSKYIPWEFESNYSKFAHIDS